MLARWLIVFGAIFGPLVIAILYMMLKSLPIIAALVGVTLACYLPLIFYHKAPVVRIGQDFQVSYQPPARADWTLIKQGLGKVALFLFFSFWLWVFIR